MIFSLRIIQDIFYKMIFLTEEALDNISSTTVKNIKDFFEGRSLEGNEVIYKE